jgi:hypothetical protein
MDFEKSKKDYAEIHSIILNFKEINKIHYITLKEENKNQITLFKLKNLINWFLRIFKHHLLLFLNINNKFGYRQ